MLQSLPRSSSRKTSRTAAYKFLRNALLLTAALATTLHAQDNKFSLDPTRSEVHFTLTDSLHTVHGAFHLQQGEITFDPNTSKATGSITVDALSGQSGNSVRDHRMTKDELKAPDFKTITFAPTRITGTLNSTGDSTLQVHGVFTLLGAPHEIDLPMQVQIDGDKLHTVGSFAVPYVQWGLKDPSTFVIHVNKEVQIDLSLVGTLRR
ncbi:MAG TPA: YceI family protein [Edaphobacter sp.]|jgi:polyisoprenoid-binding protein YceI|nr:YceI family protein [Edaphobacter sp.]